MPEAGNGPPPGWYPDPLGSGGHRWWDGTRWTQQVRDAVPTAPEQQGGVRTGPTPTAVPAAQEPTMRLPPVTGPGDAHASMPAPSPAGPHPATAGAMRGSTERRRGLPRTALVLLSIVLLVAVGAGAFLLGSQFPRTDAQGEQVATSDPSLEAGTTGQEDMTAAEPDDGQLERPPEEPGAEPPTDAEAHLDDDPHFEAEDPTDPLEDDLIDLTEDESPGGTGVDDPAVPSWELVDALDRYVLALDDGDLRGAHDLLAAELTARPGWSLSEFEDFWRGYLVGATVREVLDVDESSREVTAEVDFALAGDGLSREIVTLSLERGDTGAVVIRDYEVVRADRLR